MFIFQNKAICIDLEFHLDLLSRKFESEDGGTGNQTKPVSLTITEWKLIWELDKYSPKIKKK